MRSNVARLIHIGPVVASLALAPLLLGHCGEDEVTQATPVEAGVDASDSAAPAIDAPATPIDAGGDQATALPAPQTLAAHRAFVGSDRTTTYAFRQPEFGISVVSRINPGGLLEAPIAQRSGGLGHIVVDATNILFSDYGAVLSVSRAGGTLRTLTQNDPTNGAINVALSGATGYVLRKRTPAITELVTIAMATEPATTTAVDISVSSASLAANELGVFYIGFEGVVRRVPAEGGAAVDVTTGLTKSAMVLDGPTFYAVRLTDLGTDILSFPASGGPSTQLVTVPGAGPVGGLGVPVVATDATTIYFSNGMPGGPLFAVAKAAGAPVRTLYVPGPETQITSLAPDASSIVWTTGTREVQAETYSGAILRLPK